MLESISQRQTRLKMLAISGDAYAQFCLAEEFRTGKLGETNFERAISWYLRAADQGQKDAQHRLGTMYLTGEGVEPVMELALLWFQRASTNGNALSQYQLGYMTLYGIGCERDTALANQWLQLAASNGSFAAAVHLQLIGFDSVNIVANQIFQNTQAVPNVDQCICLSKTSDQPI